MSLSINYKNFQALWIFYMTTYFSFQGCYWWAILLICALKFLAWFLHIYFYSFITFVPTFAFNIFNISSFFCNLLFKATSDFFFNFHKIPHMNITYFSYLKPMCLSYLMLLVLFFSSSLMTSHEAVDPCWSL